MFVSMLLLLLMTPGAAFGLASPEAPPVPQSENSNQLLSPAEITELKTQATNGDAIAQTALGRAYRQGAGVRKDDQAALGWIRKAADQGYGPAENELGLMYRIGQGVTPDKQEAVRWYLKAAKHGNPRAMFNLGASYYNGDGVEADDVKSLAWFLLAREAGDPMAQEAVQRASSERSAQSVAAFAAIGKMFETGNELPKEPIEALKWYRKAADAGDDEAQVKAASLLLAQDHNPTKEEYTEVFQRCEKAAKSPSAIGAYCMAVLYKRGIGTSPNTEEYAKWLGRAANHGHARATLEFGEAYWKGEGIKSDLVKAYMWIWIAYSSKVAGAEQDEQALRKEMDPKQVERAKEDATLWLMHPPVLGLRQRQATDSPPPN